MADASVDQYTFHVEPVEDVPLICRKVKEAGMKVILSKNLDLLRRNINGILMDCMLILK